MQLYCLRVSRLQEEGKLSDTIAALAKYNNTSKARLLLEEAGEMAAVVAGFLAESRPGPASSGHGSAPSRRR